MAEREDADLTNLCGAAWIRLAGGTFGMGSDGGREDSRPVHEVRVTDFRMSRYPVTNEQYDAFVRETGRQAPEHWSGGELPVDEADHPVVHVSWHDAQAFCGWLTEKVGANDAGAHLPTEAQWEFAARGVEGREYPWGGEPPTPQRANYQESAIEGTSPVTMHADGATPDGIHDLAGNVRQWCLDWYARYEEGPQQDPTGPVQGRERVLRGGSYLDAPGTLRGAYRFNVDPNSHFGFVGFHVAWSMHGQPSS